MCFWVPAPMYFHPLTPAAVPALCDSPMAFLVFRYHHVLYRMPNGMMSHCSVITTRRVFVKCYIAFLLLLGIEHHVLSKFRKGLWQGKAACTSVIVISDAQRQQPFAHPAPTVSRRLPIGLKSSQDRASRRRHTTGMYSFDLSKRCLLTSENAL